MGKIIVYTKEDCPYCAKLKNELNEKGVNFDEIDLTHNSEAIKDVKEKYGANRVPVLVEDEKVTVGYHGENG